VNFLILGLEISSERIMCSTPPPKYKLHDHHSSGSQFHPGRTKGENKDVDSDARQRHALCNADEVIEPYYSSPENAHVRSGFGTFLTTSQTPVSLQCHYLIPESSSHLFVLVVLKIILILFQASSKPPLNSTRSLHFFHLLNDYSKISTFDFKPEEAFLELHQSTQVGKL
jgi:hypothetical protein